jgi:hypothetical protein
MIPRRFDEELRPEFEQQATVQVSFRQEFLAL